MSTETYFPRWLSNSDTSSSDPWIEDSRLLTFFRNAVVLGELGTGKSELMRELGQRLGVEPITATRFINTDNPAKLVSGDKPLLIDALDEATGRGESDAINAILAQLKDAGTPSFILACRSHEWQSRYVTILRLVYGYSPGILTLEPFTHDEASRYLHARYSNVKATCILTHLANHSLGELCRNPLMLNLMGQVAEHDSHLPTTRAALFERVCTLAWSEHNSDRQNAGLAQLTKREALDAAGAIAASLLFTGSEAVSNADTAQAQPGDLLLAELEALPNVKAAQAVFSSKIFQSIGPSRAMPVHHAIAEYLGARWIARQVPTSRAQRRLLAQMQRYGCVPARLRGLHAWLAYHSPAMAKQVIAADPYGVLRYGEITELKPHLAKDLFKALCTLAEDDPYFRKADWGIKTAAGLIIPELKSEINALIGSTTSNKHLRSLLIEGLINTELTTELADTLEEIMLSPDRLYRERKHAASALLRYRDRTWWQTTIAALTERGGQDSPQLARQLIEEIGFDVSDEQLVETVLTEMGLIHCQPPQRRSLGTFTAYYYSSLFNTIPSTRLVGILNLVADNVELLPRQWPWRAFLLETLVAYNDASFMEATSNDAINVGKFMARLLIRTIDENIVGPPQAEEVWRWLGIIQHCVLYDGELYTALSERFSSHEALRRAIQTHVIDKNRGKCRLKDIAAYLERCRVDISSQSSDLVYAFNRFAQGDLEDEGLRQDWKDLVVIGWRWQRLNPTVYAAAQQFLRDDEELADFVYRLRTQNRLVLKSNSGKKDAKRARKEEARCQVMRLELAKVRPDIRAGELYAILNPAQAYFNDLFRSRHLYGIEGLISWMGPELYDDALIGFEAVLHRDDLPTAAQIAEALAKNSFYTEVYAIMAGFYERMRTQKGITDLSMPLKQVALLLCYMNGGRWTLYPGPTQALREALEAEVITTPQARQDFARLWGEAYLAADTVPFSPFFKLAHEPAWQETIVVLAADWLRTFPNISEPLAARLVEFMIHYGAFDALRKLAEDHSGAVFSTDGLRPFWLAMNVFMRFEDTLPDLNGIGARNREFLLCLLNRLQIKSNGGLFPLTLAQIEWIITEFRPQWPSVTLEDSNWGNTDAKEAANFLRILMNRIVENTSPEASEAIQRLVSAPVDSYHNLLCHMAAEQRQKRAEEDLLPVPPDALAALLNNGAASTIANLKALLLEMMDRVRH